MCIRDRYYDYQIDELKEIQPSHVEIPLRQHIGAPSEAVVKAGEKVVCGQLIGKKPQKEMCIRDRYRNDHNSGH